MECSKTACIKGCIKHLIVAAVFGAGVAALVSAGWHPASFTEGGLATLLQLAPEFKGRVICMSGVGAGLIYLALTMCCAMCRKGHCNTSDACCDMPAKKK